MGAVLFVVFVAIAIGGWIASYSFDKSRITQYVEGRGGRVVSITWAPFGKGWFGEKNDRIYEVVYYDRAGDQHLATCKTSLWSGVYWTEDRTAHRKSNWYDSLSPTNEPGHSLIQQVPSDWNVEKENELALKLIHDEPANSGDQRDELERLREENARLRNELEQLRG